jgi:rare lipoprotein A
MPRKGMAAALVAAMALGGAMTSPLAQEAVDSDLALSAPALPDTTSGITLSEETSFDTAFDHLQGQLAEPSMPPHAVDMATIEPPHGPRHLGTGVASYYGRRFNGRLTANGETFDMNAMTAAHRTLPFGSMVRVTNPRNGKSVVVRVNDRGPFVEGREIDISRAAAEEIGLINRGHGEVELELVE